MSTSRIASKKAVIATAGIVLMMAPIAISLSIPDPQALGKFMRKGPVHEFVGAYVFPFEAPVSFVCGASLLISLRKKENS